MAEAIAQTPLSKLKANWTCFILFHIICSLTIVTYSSQATIKTLPGFNGTLPFLLETGYVTVGKENDIQLFYYFVESESDSQNHPLLLWLAGGPGCSGFTSFAYDNGPLHFDATANAEDLPSLVLNPYSWTKIASIIYLDSPVGTGFSYATSSQGYYSSNTKCATDIYDFLRKWLLDHPKFIRNSLYIGGDSYAGMYVPMVTWEIDKGNKAGYSPYMSLQGYVLGNPFTNFHEDANSRMQYGYRMAIISDEYYKSVKSSCNGEYVNTDPNNLACIFYIKLITESVAWLNEENIVDDCNFFVPPNMTDLKWAKRSLLQKKFSSEIPKLLMNFKCMEDNLADIWGNDPRVQKALHTRKDTKPEWLRCNRSVAFEKDVDNVVDYHRNLSRRNYRALVYSGDHDMVVPYIATLSWIQSLNISIEDDWRPWFVDNQVAGYIEEYKKNGYSLTFATVKGAGHVALEYKPKELFALAKRWFSMSHL